MRKIGKKNTRRKKTVRKTTNRWKTGRKEDKQVVRQP